MKKFKIFLPVFMLALLLTSAIRTEASNVKVSSGATSAQVTLTVKDMQSFEAEISLPKGFGLKSAPSLSFTDDDGKDAKAKVESSTATSEKIFVVTKGVAVDTKISMTLTISSDVEDGYYTVKLKNASGTNKKGKYPTSISSSVTITLGNPVVPTPTPTKAPSKTDKDADKDDQAAKATAEPTAAPVNYEVLRLAIDEAEALMEKDSSLKEHQPLVISVNNAHMLLTSDSQEAVDAGADELIQLLTVLQDSQKVSNSSPKRPSGLGGGFNFWWIVLIILAITAVGLAMLYVYLNRKKQKTSAVDFEGAPMIEYNITEDDEF